MIRHFPGAVALLLLLTACQQAVSPPVLTLADHQRAMLVDILGVVPDNADLAALTATESLCVDLNWGGITLAQEASMIGWFDRLLLRTGLWRPQGNWQKPVNNLAPTAESSERARMIAPALEERIRTAHARAILAIGGAAAEQVPAQWADTCQSRYWHRRPIYDGQFAFVETGLSDGPHAGHGTILALEFRRGAWHVVAEYVSWIA